MEKLGYKVTTLFKPREIGSYRCNLLGYKKVTKVTKKVTK